MSRILKYMYNNQQLASIVEEISAENIYSLYAQAYALDCVKLLEDLRTLIVTKLLNEQNV